MYLIDLLLSFKGRIGRKAWWLGFIIVNAASLAGAAFLDPAFMTEEAPAPPNLALTLWSLAWMIPGTAIIVKRFNDRDYAPWLGYGFGALAILFTLAEARGYFLDPERLTLAEQIVLWPFTVLALAVLVDNGFRRGAPGPNRYGPSPVDETRGDAMS